MNLNLKEKSVTTSNLYLKKKKKKIWNMAAASVHRNDGSVLAISDTRTG